MDTLGDRLRLLRLKKGLKQIEVAKAIGVTKQNLYKYEKNIITNVPSDKIEALAKLYDSTPAYIMGWEDDAAEEKKAFLLKIGNRIKTARLKMGYSQEHLSELCGYNSRSTINKIEMGINDIPQSKLQKIADVLGVSPAYLINGEAESSQTIKSQAIDKPSHLQDRQTTAVRIPVLGDVAAGIPISAIEDIIDWEEITEQLASTGEFFGLRIQGDSMAPRICDGDVVIVRQQADAETGDIVIVRVDHERATCKRLRKYADGAVELISLNPSYEPMFFAKEELDDDYVVIVGVVVELRGKL